MPDRKILLGTRSLKKYFHTPSGELHAVDNVSMQIVQGQILEVVGESGHGKFTLGRTIPRLSEPSSRQILFDGRDTLKCGREDMQNLRTDMQIVFQDPYAPLNPRMTVSEIIGQSMMVNKICRKKSEMGKRVTEPVDTVGLASRLYNVHPHELDDGRRQRAGTARALSLNPKFVVCDESVSALNVSIQAQILNLLMDLQEQRDLTYMFITHNLSVAEHISSEIMVIYSGQCTEKASNRELFKGPLHPYIQTFSDSIPVPRLQGRSGKRQSIKGEIMSPISPVPGCCFAPRCPRAAEERMDHDTPLKDVPENHQVTCVLLN